MAWFWLEYAQSLQFIGLLFNTSVHVVMYYYYFRRVLGWPVWWKRYVTTFQIVQVRAWHVHVWHSMWMWSAWYAHGNCSVCAWCLWRASCIYGAHTTTPCVRAHRVRQFGQRSCAMWSLCPCYSLVTYYPPLMHQFGTSACVGMVTLAMLASGADCAGPRVLVFNFIFNMTLMYQFFGVLGGSGKPKGPEGAKRL